MCRIQHLIWGWLRGSLKKGERQKVLDACKGQTWAHQ